MRRNGSFILSGAAIALFTFSGLAPAQTPPPDSESKVKRVLMYKKYGDYKVSYGIKEVHDAFAYLAREQGFRLDTLDTESGLTLELLRQYQVIVWNNNAGGAFSVMNQAAQKAVIDYVEEGGGWMLIHLAAYSYSSWPALGNLLGVGSTGWGRPGWAHIFADTSAKRHPELKHVISAIPDTVRLYDYWLRFGKSVRRLPGFTVLYTSGNGDPNTLEPYADNTEDRTYIWARDSGKGKVLYNGFGRGGETDELQVKNQAGGAMSMLYWQSLRWLAGDFKNGCTNPGSQSFDPEARIDDGSCGPTGIRSRHRDWPAIITLPGRSVRLGAPVYGTTAILHNAQGVKVREFPIPDGSDAVHLGDDGIQPGIYFLEIRGKGAFARYRLMIP